MSCSASPCPPLPPALAPVDCWSPGLTTAGQDHSQPSKLLNTLLCLLLIQCLLQLLCKAAYHCRDLVAPVPGESVGCDRQPLGYTCIPEQA